MTYQIRPIQTQSYAENGTLSYGKVELSLAPNFTVSAKYFRKENDLVSLVE